MISIKHSHDTKSAHAQLARHTCTAHKCVIPYCWPVLYNYRFDSLGSKMSPLLSHTNIAGRQADTRHIVSAHAAWG